MTEERNVDPRFPAVFQRGYQGGASEVSMTHRAAQSRNQAVEQPAPPAPSHAPSPLPSHSADGIANSPPQIVQPEEPRFNPFISALWVASLGLAVAGVWLVAWSQFSQGYTWTGNEPPTDTVIRQIAYFISAPIITSGLLGVLGLLFWHAAAWRRRAIAEQQHPQH